MKATELRPQDITRVPLHKRAIVPWAIIVIVTAFFAGVITGSIMTHAEQDKINATASQMVTSLSKPQSR